MRQYEAMFLFDPTFATDMSKVAKEVERLMERAGAEIVMSDKWEERKLAYEIEGRKRGCYVLTFIRAEPDKIVGIERDAQLSEPILRVLIIRADHMTEDDMKKAYPRRARAESPASKDEPAAATEAPSPKVERPEAKVPAAEAASEESVATTAVAEPPEKPEEE